MQAQLMRNYVTGALDRHAGNYLITADGKLAVIDHALSFVWPLSSFVDWQFDELLRGILTNEQFVQGAGWANLARISDVPLSAAAVERIVSRSDALLQIATAAGTDTAPLEEPCAVLQRFLY